MARGGRIARKFIELRARNQAALIPFIVAGDPEIATTRQLVLELEARGADLVELGVPFSDPMADGPANQRAIARGLKSGASLPAILSMVSELRQATQIPLILYGYFNPYLHYGCERLCRDAATAGVDAILAVDLPTEESAELLKPARANGLDLIYLFAPTTPLERSRRIARSARRARCKPASDPEGGAGVGGRHRRPRARPVPYPSPRSPLARGPRPAGRG